jgi:hypothetical protein
MLRSGWPVEGKQLKVLRKACGTSASPTMTRNNASATGASAW